MFNDATKHVASRSRPQPGGVEQLDAACRYAADALAALKAEDAGRSRRCTAEART